ncbi:MAG: DUF1588 domain-containing protein, partial [Lentisphaeraceae bacterium]|nr:DUF1588 domain-containing protein [Lentisphaeraceae bacterium]
PKIYPEYDSALHWSMEQEVYAFFKELISKNLSATNVVDADFVMINDRLAEHYQLPKVEGSHIRKVKLPAQSPRGGVLGMAAIHKVTSNGTTTSPVLRGIWVLERVMGIHPPPPPPGVPAVEPDIRGATSIIDQLEMHRNNKRCSACHKMIDPPGIAMESFDVIGQWRENYRALSAKKQEVRVVVRPNSKVPQFYHVGQAVVSNSELRDGSKFKNIIEFKKLLLKDTEKVTANVVEKLLSYATGAGVRFADRYEVKQIVAKTKKQNHGMRSIIHEIVKSKIFKRK